MAWRALIVARQYTCNRGKSDPSGKTGILAGCGSAGARGRAGNGGAKRFLREESGQALVLTIVCLTLLMGMMALAVDQETFRCFARGAPGEVRGSGKDRVPATFLNAKRWICRAFLPIFWVTEQN